MSLEVKILFITVFILCCVIFVMYRELLKSKKEIQKMKIQLSGFEIRQKSVLEKIDDISEKNRIQNIERL